MAEPQFRWRSLALAGVAFFVLLLTGCSSSSSTTTKLTVVQADAMSPASVQLAVQACAGLYNRKAGGSVLIELEAHDAVWVDALPLKVSETISQADFLNRCVAAFPSCVRYDYKAQQALLPNILTVASVLDAVPLDDAQTMTCSNPAFDATQVFADKKTPALATSYVFAQFGKQTTGLAMLNPGYDDHPSDPAHPALTNDMQPVLVDFVFSQKLFVVYLVNGCASGDPENAALNSIVNAGNWPTPLGVYGYNSSWNIMGGDLYEAQTLCLNSHNMGAIASETGNLSYYSTAKAPIVDANVVQQNAAEQISYDATKTYVAFVVGDGDNIGYMMTTRHDWFVERVNDCATDSACLPLTWTISPHLPQLAPDLTRWYYDQSHQTGKDYFTLPPSGHLYAYPSSMSNADQDRFVASTEQDARILGVTGTVHWDWFENWQAAETHFLPKYATVGGAIRGIFPVDVPYSSVAFPAWPPDQFFEVLSGSDGGQTVLFRPREWRGVTDDTSPYLLSPQKMADEIAGYPKGTVTWVYMTSDGGLSLDNAFFPLAKLLPANVQLVSADAAAQLALAASMK
jgi:hypothetical protein